MRLTFAPIVLLKTRIERHILVKKPAWYHPCWPMFWCRRRDSNSYSLRHYPLKIACLPISPRRHKAVILLRFHAVVNPVLRQNKKKHDKSLTIFAIAKILPKQCANNLKKYQQRLIYYSDYITSGSSLQEPGSKRLVRLVRPARPELPQAPRPERQVPPAGLYPSRRR